MPLGRFQELSRKVFKDSYSVFLLKAVVQPCPKTRSRMMEVKEVTASELCATEDAMEWLL